MTTIQVGCGIHRFEARFETGWPLGAGAWLGRRRRIEKSVEKPLAAEATERQHLAFVDGTGRDLLGTAHDKIRQRAAGEIGSALE